MEHRTTRSAAASLLFVFFFWHSNSFAKQANVDLSRGESSVTFVAIGRPSMLKIHGKSDKPLHGTLTIAGQKLSGKCSFDLESLTTGLSLRDDHMKHKYLETEKYPQASLSFTKAALSSDKAPFEGSLTLHGVSKPIRGNASFSNQAGKMRIAAEFELDIAEYGISQPSFSGITMAKKVNVQVNVNAPITNQ
jgi:polyisoprenoid-binding protein YceI